jgi:glycosyltransferase involved in cell wall biosynthesis
VRRVLFLAYHFPPIGGAGVQRNAKFVRYLPEFGYEPVVITGPGPTSDRWTPVDGTLSADIPSGTEVHRLQGEPTPSSGWRARAERWAWRKSPWHRWWDEQVVDIGRRRAGDADLVYASLVPFEAATAAMRLARELGLPLVVDLQDPWALDEMMIYPSAVHRRVEARRMRQALAAADGIVMNTPESVARVLRAFPELRDKVVVSTPNGFDAADFEGPPPHRSDGRFRIVHTGYLHTELGFRHRRVALARRILGGYFRDVDILTRSHVFLLEAVSRLIADQPALASQIEVHLAGVLTDADRDVAAGSPVARLHGYLPHHETIALMRSADLLFLPLHDLPPGNRLGIIPGKTYEYLASRRPILAAVPDGDIRDLLTEAGNAFVCWPADVPAMMGIVSEQLERTRRGEPAPEPDPDVLARFERRQLTAELAAAFDRVCSLRQPERASTAVPEPA